MDVLYLLPQTASLQSGQRDRKSHRSSHTLAPILTCTCVHVSVSAHAGCCPVTVSDHGPLVEDSRPHGPFPSAPAMPYCPLACGTDWQSCYGDG